MGIFGYIRKVKKIQKNIGSIAIFTPAEIVSGIVNLWEAKQKLTYEEYFYVNIVYETYKMLKNKLTLDCFGFLSVCNELIAHFDLIAPYYKFCGNPQLQIAKFIDREKIEYRCKAKKLLEEKQLFNENWMTLHKEFLEKFYA